MVAMPDLPDRPDTALLIMDVQSAIVDRFVDGAPALLETVGRAAFAARTHGLPVIYIRIAFRPGAPEISRNNRNFAALSNLSAYEEDSAAMQIHPAVAPQPGDIVVVKKRVSAFAGSDLDMVLRSQTVTRLVLTGIATSGVVLSTLRQAADLDYGLTVLRDCCLDADPEVHRVLIDKIFARQADVLTADEWVERIEESERPDRARGPASGHTDQ
jgi:nicotinamidase-related amidase